MFMPMSAILDYLGHFLVIKTFWGDYWIDLLVFYVNQYTIAKPMVTIILELSPIEISFLDLVDSKSSIDSVLIG